MTKKNFIALADSIKEHNRIIGNAPASMGMRSHLFKQSQILALADWCQEQNPQFNRSRWLDYIAGKCGPNGGAR